MHAALAVLGIQGVLGAYDNFRNHEFREGLPLRTRQRGELLLHAAREGFYLVLFPTMAWLEWRGWLAYALGLIIVCEIVVTCWDFVEEDRTRRLSANERVLHTLLTLTYGAFLALLAPELLDWSRLSTGIVFVDRGYWSWLMTIYSLGVLVFGIRELSAGLSMGRAATTGSVDLHHRIFASTGAEPCPGFARFYAGVHRAARGTASVTTGGRFARLLLALMGLSMRDGKQPLSVTFEADGTGELWRRDFATGHFTSRMEAPGKGKLGIVEFFGPFAFHFDWDVSERTIDWAFRRAFVFGLPIGKAFAPRIFAREWFTETGSYEMLADVSLPWIGPLLRYSAVLERVQIGEPISDSRVVQASESKP